MLLREAAGRRALTPHLRPILSAGALRPNAPQAGDQEAGGGARGSGRSPREAA